MAIVECSPKRCKKGVCKAWGDCESQPKGAEVAEEKPKEQLGASLLKRGRGRPKKNG